MMAGEIEAFCRFGALESVKSVVKRESTPPPSALARRRQGTLWESRKIEALCLPPRLLQYVHVSVLCCLVAERRPGMERKDIFGAVERALEERGGTRPLAA